MPMRTPSFALLSILVAAAAPRAGEAQRLEAGARAPDFQVADLRGDTLSLSSLRGRKVLLTFYRNVGCPVCNLRFHELQDHANRFRDRGLALVSVYESAPENVRLYAGEDSLYSRMIPDPGRELYRLYRVERSMGKMMAGMLHGAMGKMGRGKKLFTRKIPQDGHMDRIGADFLIDEAGMLSEVHYGRHLGDHLDLQTIDGHLSGGKAGQVRGPE